MFGLRTRRQTELINRIDEPWLNNPVNQIVGADPLLRLRRFSGRLACPGLRRTWWRIVARYRSATAAEFHGIPQFLKAWKEHESPGANHLCVGENRKL